MITASKTVMFRPSRVLKGLGEGEAKTYSTGMLIGGVLIALVLGTALGYTWGSPD